MRPKNYPSSGLVVQSHESHGSKFTARVQHMPFLHDEHIKELIINHINPSKPDKIEVAMVSGRSVVNYPVVKLMTNENLTHPH